MPPRGERAGPGMGLPAPAGAGRMERLTVLLPAGIFGEAGAWPEYTIMRSFRSSFGVWYLSPGDLAIIFSMTWHMASESVLSMSRGEMISSLRCFMRTSAGVSPSKGGLPVTIS